MRRPTSRQVLDRRRADRAALVTRAERFADELDVALGVRAVVVFGSVARGDFHDASDVDVLIVAEHLPQRALERNAAVGLAPPRVEFVAWTPEEWRQERDRGNPIAVEAIERGRLLRGSLD
ncbi:MAG: nucleotidyltransferase domain-containing protein [Egibacteraceae bacterium]